MNYAQTRKDKMDRKERLNDQLWSNDREKGMYLKGLEQYPQIKAFKRWQALPEIDKAALLEAWDEYYKAVQTGRRSKRYFTIGEAWSAHDTATMKELIKQAKEDMEPEFVKPSEIDPMEFENNDIYIKYKYIQSELKTLNTKSENDIAQAFL